MASGLGRPSSRYPQNLDQSEKPKMKMTKENSIKVEAEHTKKACRYNPLIDSNQRM